MDGNSNSNLQQQQQHEVFLGRSPRHPGYINGLYNMRSHDIALKPSSIDKNHTKAIRAAQQIGPSLPCQNIRLAFIRKVYMILMAQLFFAFALISAVVLVLPMKELMSQNGGPSLFIVGLCVALLSCLAEVCGSTRMGRNIINFVTRANFVKFPPQRLSQLAILQAFGVLLMSTNFSSYHRTEVVYIVMVVTAMVTFAVTLFASHSNIDYTRNYCSSIILTLGVTFLLATTAYDISDFSKNQLPRTVSIAIGGLASVMYMAHVTQSVVSNLRQEEEPIYFASHLSSFIGFFYIISLLMGASFNG